MVDYDTAVAVVQDPNADPVFLAKIAYENPEFGANVAVNPRAYPGLLRWIAQFGDARARQTVAQLGYVAQVDAIHDQPGPDEEPVIEEASIFHIEPEQSPNPAFAQTGQQPESFQTPAAEQPVQQEDHYGQMSQTPFASQYGVGNGTENSASGANAAEPEPQHAAQDHQPDHSYEQNGTYAGAEYGQAPQNAQPEHAEGAFQQPNYQGQPQQAVYGQGQYAQPEAHMNVNPYGFTPQMAMETTDPMQMQQIAQYAPELHSYLAANPYLYPELVNWLGSLNNPQVNAVLAQRQR